MPILFSSEILNAVKKELQNATQSVQIITAYCKESSFLYLNNCISAEVNEKKLLVRFRLDDILKGSSDFTILESGLNNGWKVFIRFDLHAKTYIVDNKRGLIGSANTTNSGLNIGNHGNLEMATIVDIEPEDIEKVNRLFNDAILVNEVILDNLKKQFADVKQSDVDNKETHCWNTTITSMFKPHIETLFSYELPDDSSLIEGKYYSFIDVTFDGNVQKFKEAFRWSKAFMWLISTLKKNDGCLYFGALAEKLHNVLVSDPRPYRRDVKYMLRNLLTLAVNLQIEEIVIDRPNYSQRVSLKGFSKSV